MRWLAVADDLTGAHDLGGRLAGRGSETWVARDWTELRGREGDRILDVETRFDPPGLARAKVQAAWTRLGGEGGLRFQKLDSTLRGNPGEEVEGLLLGASAPWVAILPAYPAMGRQTLGGWQHVNGVRLDRSEYARDPLTPSRAARPQDLFPRRLSAHAPLAVLAGPSRLAAWLERALARGARFITFDCADEDQAGIIARACLASGGRHYAGASGLAGALADILGGPPRAAQPPQGLPWLVAAGSVSASSFDQLRALAASGVAWAPRLRRQGSAWRPAPPALALRRRLRRDGMLALSSLAGRGELGPWRLRQARRGLGPQACADEAVRALARWARRVAGPLEGAGYLLTGGHTLAAFFDLAGLAAFHVHGQALPGLPLGVAEGPGGRAWIASKPGGFGGPDLLARFKGLAPWR